MLSVWAPVVPHSAKSYVMRDIALLNLDVGECLRAEISYVSQGGNEDRSLRMCEIKATD